VDIVPIFSCILINSFYIYFIPGKRTLIEKQIDNWIKIAEEKLTGTNIKVFWMIIL
jgi:hypothetical protein